MEAIYKEMNERNVPYKTPPKVNHHIDEGRCLAAYAVGNWYLEPSFQRLWKILQPLLSPFASLYRPTPLNQEGLLHQTLLQFVGFDAYPSAPELSLKAMEMVADILAQSNLALWIEYRGLVWTPTGLALSGYCHDYDKLMKVRKAIEDTLTSLGLPCSIPYQNNILHATLVRWTKLPDAMVLYKLEDIVKRWSECTFGTLQVNRWLVGKGSWRMLESEREDYFAVPVYRHVCHRGNLVGPVRKLENNFGILIQREIQGHEVEVDVWYHENTLWLGHDKPEYKITLEWLANSNRRWIHAKDGKTFEYLLLEKGKRALDIHVFYHTKEDYALTNKGVIICYPGKTLLEGSCCMMPEQAYYTDAEKQKCFVICSDTMRKTEA